MWDSVLAMEGAVLFASLTTKRLRSTAFGHPACLRSLPALPGAAYQGRATGTLPVWGGASTYPRFRLRGHHKGAQLKCMDMLQAVASLGVDRGIAAFNRFGFYERRGLGYYVATHLGRFDVPEVAIDNWVISELNQQSWLNDFRSFAHSEHASARFMTLRQRLEDRLFALAGKTPSRPEAQALLILLGEIQSSLAVSNKARGAVQPIPRLSERWVIAADDNSPAFRIARALAGLRGVDGGPLPLRAQLFPIHRRFDRWLTPEAGKRPASDLRRSPCRCFAQLISAPSLLAERRHARAAGERGGGDARDIAAFLRGDGMDAYHRPAARSRALRSPKTRPQRGDGLCPQHSR